MQFLTLSSTTDEANMNREKDIVRIDLTQTQKQVVKKEIGKDVEALELTVKDLEERIAPLRVY